ncbi:MAG: PEP-CTERM/exosortase system-associated acyltransferase [Hahellaceae bacterium]|nr:PEP-CTERM/exosortase system-associated acyltransferase [Hahellaceae bacterium]
MVEEDLPRLFDTYFEVILADTRQLQEECFRIRYEVYCAELSFEDKSAFPEQMEMDDFDSFSHHYLIRHKASGSFAGTVRLVDPGLAPFEGATCPMVQYCSHAIQNEDLHPSRFPINSITEVSRLAVPSAFRRRTGEQGKPFIYEGERISLTDIEKKAFPYIAIGLYLAAAAHFVNEASADYVYVMMEPRLALHLRRVGINFKQLGEPVEYHGLRAAFYIDKPQLLRGMAPGMRGLYNLIESTVVAQMEEKTTLPVIHYAAAQGM